MDLWFMANRTTHLPMRQSSTERTALCQLNWRSWGSWEIPRWRKKRKVWWPPLPGSVLAWPPLFLPKLDFFNTVLSLCTKYTGRGQSLWVLIRLCLSQCFYSSHSMVARVSRSLVLRLISPVTANRCPVIIYRFIILVWWILLSFGHLILLFICKDFCFYHFQVLTISNCM